MSGRLRRFAPPASGGFTPSEAKTVVTVLSRGPGKVAAVIGSARAGRTDAGRAVAGGLIPVMDVVAAAAGALPAFRRDHATAA